MVTVASKFFTVIKGQESFKIIFQLLLKLFRNLPVKGKHCWVSDLWIVTERIGGRLGCLFADHVFAHPNIILFTSYLYVERGRKFFFSSNLAMGFYLLKHWKLPTARGRMLSVLIIVIAAAFLTCSVCAPCSSA